MDKTFRSMNYDICRVFRVFTLVGHSNYLRRVIEDKMFVIGKINTICDKTKAATFTLLSRDKDWICTTPV